MVPSMAVVFEKLESGHLHRLLELPPQASDDMNRAATATKNVTETYKSDRSSNQSGRCFTLFDLEMAKESSVAQYGR